MSRYTATIHHHSISSARIEDVGDTLAAAKRNATREFGDGFVDHTIIIRDTAGGYCDTVATRRIGDARWTIWR